MAGSHHIESEFDNNTSDALNPQNPPATSQSHIGSNGSSSRRLNDENPSTSSKPAAANNPTKTLRTALVLARSYLADYLRNPAMAGAAILPVAAALLFRVVTGDNSNQESFSAWLDMFYTLYAFMFVGLMVSAMHVMYDMGEEAEKGARAVLFRAGVTPTQLAFGRLLAASFLLFLMCAASCMVLGMPAQLLLPFTLIGFICLLPLPVVGCALGLLARTLNDVMVTSTPLIVVGLIPFVLYLKADTLGFLIPYVPTGAMLNFAEGLAAGDLLSQQGLLCLSLTALWLLLAAGALGLTLHRMQNRHV